jgi:tetratricopeptide (TPR) repeat protein
MNFVGYRMVDRSPRISILTAAFFLIVFSALVQSCTRKTEPVASEEITEVPQLNFVGSGACQSCHPKEFDDWKRSDHFLAMQDANESTVLGDFDDVTFTADGVTNRFYKRDGKFIINTQGEDGKNHDYEVLYTFGHFPLQQYLIAFPGGRLQATRVSWDSRDKKWFHQYPGQEIHHRDWLHWTGNAQNWNTMCASCHSTDLQKNYQFSSDTYSTTWNEMNVSCESCHGPGSKHVSLVSSGSYQNDSLGTSGLTYANSTDPQIQLNTCAPCHARKSDLSQNMIHSKEIMDDIILQIITNEFYFADGQIDDEDYEYGSFVQSKMFHNNVRCSSCHNPHSGKRLAEGNALCMSCHEPRYNSKEHHFHESDSEGSQCINCHMPGKTYMGNDHRRDHSFRIPRPDQSVTYGTPDACTGCHKSKSAAWASEAIREWYGPVRSYHFSDDLLPGSQLTDKSAFHLIKLLRDTLQPEIARATAAYYLAGVQAQQSSNALLGAVKDKKAMVRYQAIRSLENFPPEVWMQHVHPALSDRVRAVRIAAADLYHRVPDEMIPTVARNAFQAADAENRKYLMYQADFAVGNVMLADYELQEGDHLNAIAHYIRGLKKDSLMNYARLNLSASFNAVGKNSEALVTLQEAAEIDPKNDRIFYNLALLYYELQNVPAAMENFQKALRLGSRNPGVYYNYGLLLQQAGKMNEAEKVLLSGFAIDSEAININYALAYYYVSQHQTTKAKIYATNLKKLDPNNPGYQALFQSLGL